MRNFFLLIIVLLAACSSQTAKQSLLDTNQAVRSVDSIKQQLHDSLEIKIIRQSNDKYLLLAYSEKKDEYYYLNRKGDTILQLARYSMPFTDTFRTYAIVLFNGFVAIDRNLKVLYKVFPFDNGPDYISDGLFRIIIDGKIGYANEKGEIIIQPKFDCALPFENGKAKVSMDCHEVDIDEEHRTWKSDHWFYIDKNGKEIK